MLHTDATSSPRSPSVSASETPSPPRPPPLRKLLKEEAKARKAAGYRKPKGPETQTVPGWELTVGIEIHAQLNTARKLFSSAANTFDTKPNTHTAFFDLAIPGSQPVFQRETLVPAVRAALALGCDVQRVSRWDRKHYMHWDQPAGYQLTQYYEPLARDGHITLYARDGIAAADGAAVRVDIQQVQMEQDTAKTVAQAAGVRWLDFNRAGAPLLEIITRPQLHHPATAAALVRKVQQLLAAVDACVVGMEEGGLRADVNVSVRRAAAAGPAAPLGTRVEIKNLVSFRGIQAAIVHERDRQIALIEAGGEVRPETRRWDGFDSVSLRGKEGVVDYRYMPDPDLGPVVIGDDVVDHLRSSMGELPDTEIEGLVRCYGLTPKDASALVLLDGGGRVEFYYNVVDAMEDRLGAEGHITDGEATASPSGAVSHRALAGKWVLNELGRLTSERNAAQGDGPTDLEMTAEGTCRIPTAHLADILFYLHRKRITAEVAKDLLFAVHRGDVSDVTEAIEAAGLWFRGLSAAEYQQLAQAVLESDASVMKAFARAKTYPEGKLMFLVGNMMRAGPEGRVDAKTAADVMRELVRTRLAAFEAGESGPES